jgi:ATP-dependent DNA helicase RecQ
VLRGGRIVPLRKEAAKTARTRKPGRSAGAKAASVDLDPAGTARFEALRTWRAATAAEANLPAYVIFHDATLREIAALAPTSLEQLLGVSGVGAGKLDKYGAAVLEVVQG